MKKRNNSVLNEISRTRNLMKKVISEQYEKPKSDGRDCLMTYLRFAFTPTEYEDEVDYDDEYANSNIVGGGDLGLWNNNKLPSVDDDRAFERFVEYMKDVSSEGDAIYDEEECEGIFFEDMEPILKDVYNEFLSNYSPNTGRSSNERKGSDDGTLQKILDIAMETPQDDYNDPFDWLNAVFSDAEFELDDESGEFRSKYGGDVLELWGKN